MARVTASFLVGALASRVFLTMALTSCAVYNEPSAELDPDGETAGSRGEGGQGVAGSLGGATVGSGGTSASGGSMTFDDAAAGAPPVDDAPSSLNETTSSPDSPPEVDGSTDAGPQPILHYKFDETTGNIVNDSSGNARNGTAIGTHTWVTGRIGNAMAFDGASAFVVLPIGVVSTLNEATIATWVQLDASRVWQRIADFGNNTTVYMFLTPTSMAGKVQLAITTNSNPGQQLLNGTTAWPLATWKHLAVVLDGQKASLYVDGALESTSAITLRLADLGTTASNWLGRSQYMQDPYFKGQLDDFRIYDRALTAEQVAAIAHP